MTEIALSRENIKELIWGKGWIDIEPVDKEEVRIKLTSSGEDFVKELLEESW